MAWEGDFEGLHSLALVNRAICRGLIERGHEVRQIHERNGLDGGGLDSLVQVHVRHRWPPRWNHRQHGKWVLMQPWEYGSLPKAWLPMLRRVDEVWAYSRYVRDCYLRGRRAARPRPCRSAGRRSGGLPAGAGAAGTSARPSNSVPVRGRDDLSQGDRRAPDGLRPGISARRWHRAGHQGDGCAELLPRPDGRG